MGDIAVEGRILLQGIFKNQLGSWNRSIGLRVGKVAVSYNRIPNNVVKSELESLSVDKWQSDWNQTTKWTITKDYFPKVIN